MWYLLKFLFEYHVLVCDFFLSRINQKNDLQRLSLHINKVCVCAEAFTFANRWEFSRTSQNWTIVLVVIIIVIVFHFLNIIKKKFIPIIFYYSRLFTVISPYVYLMDNLIFPFCSWRNPCKKGWVEIFKLNWFPMQKVAVFL